MTQYISPYRRFLGAFVPNWLLERKEVSTGAKLCYARLAQHAGKDEWCWPTQRLLSEELGTNLRQIQRYVAELKSCGLIETKDRGTGRSQAYYFCEHEWMSAYAAGSVAVEPPDLSYRRDQGSDSSEDSSEEESSSSSEEEEDFLNQATAFYSPAAQSRLRSPILHPGRYFEEWRRNGDSLPVRCLPVCKEMADVVCEAVNVGYPDTKLVTLPHPLLLPGLAACLEPTRRYSLRPQFLRLALYDFCEHDGVDPPELRGADVLERIAKRPDLFAEALRQQSEALG